MSTSGPTPNTSQGSGRSAPANNKNAAAMRRQRANKEFRRKERLAAQLVKDTMRELIKRHPDEYRIVLNEKRIANGLRPIRMRGHRRVELQEAPAVPITEPETQQQCPHNQGVNKLPYGTFCKQCGHRIR